MRKFITSILLALSAAVITHAQTVSLNTNFEGCGTFTTAFANNGTPLIRHTLIKPGGKILSAGYSNETYNTLFAQYNANGSTDAGFGVNGKSVISLNTRTFCEYFTLQPDGKIVAVGTDAPDNASSAHIPLILRLNENGTIDNSFGVNGKVALRFDNVSSGGFTRVIVLPDGKILAAGLSSGNINGGTAGPGMMKFNADGTLDNSFGNITGFPGRARLPLNYTGNVNMFVQPDGKIILAYSRDVTGNSSPVNIEIVRFLSNGTVDNSFGTNGTLVASGINMEGILSSAVQPDGKILFACTSNNELNPANPTQIQVLRYLPDFTPDAAFGNNGIANLNNLDGSGLSFYNTNIAVQPDGKILISAGNSSGYPNNSPMLIRLSNIGQLDVAYNNAGYYYTPTYNETNPHPSLIDVIAVDNNTCIVSTAVNYRITSLTTIPQPPPPLITFFQDVDNDGFGNPAVTIQSCTAPTGYVSNNTDCDDSKLLYADNDGDGFGAGAPVACGVNNYTDCNDGNATAYPGGTEICGNGIDENCNGMTDDVCVAGLNVELNYSFGDCGTFTTAFTNNGTQLIRHTLIKPGGKILSAGYSNETYNTLFAQYNANSSTDAGFGVNGKSVISFNARTFCEYFTLQPDGKIVAVGTDAPDNASSAHIPLIFRLNENGTVDNSFGINGKMALRFDNVSSGSLTRVIVLPDGKILAAGLSSGNINGGTAGPGMMKFNADGTLDNSFGNLPGFPGRTRLPLNYTGHVNLIVQTDGKIILAYSRDVTGNSSPVNLEIVRFLSNGTVDNSFGTNGTLVANGINMEGILSSAVQPDGKIIFSCTSNNDLNPATATKIVALRYLPDFTADASFGNAGYVELSNLDGSGISFYNTNLGLQPDGKILISGGRSSGYPNNSPMLVRLNSNGQLDAGFNFTGYYFIPTYITVQLLNDIIAADNNSCIVSSEDNFRLTKLTSEQQAPTAGGLNFDGGNDEVQLGSWFDNKQTFTVELWIKPAPTQTQYSTIIYNSGWQFYRTAGNVSDYYFYASGGPSGEQRWLSAPLLLNEWQHIALVKDIASMKVYRNGLLMDEQPFTGNIYYPPTPFYLGRGLVAGQDWNGTMDEVRFWDRPLTEAEIQTRMNCELNCIQSDLLAYYKFNQGFSNCNNEGLTTLTDASTNNRNGTLVNFSLSGSSSNWVGGNVTGNCSSAPITYYPDSDADGYGTGTGQLLCNNPGAGYTVQGGDCNDGNAAVNPGATEICNGIDDDCDGQIDEDGQSTFYQDADGDGFGNAAVTILTCMAPVGYVNISTDCNDANAAVHPGATEVCNGIDDDCDGQIDEGVLSTFYQDADGDGFGNAGVTMLSCIAPAGYVNNSTDCNDANAVVNPDATEVCNGIDDDCDGQVDENAEYTFYLDFDGDGFGNPADAILACIAPTSYVSNNLDCNDSRFNIYPGAPEICDGDDNDCDGEIDEGIKIILYLDSDNDGYGSGSGESFCFNPGTGYAIQGGDCNDHDPSIHPGAIEVCNNIDDNCNGLIDAADPGLRPELCKILGVCSPYGGFRTCVNGVLSPCNYPASYDELERCDGLDNNCDGFTDAQYFYRDADGDGYGNPDDNVLLYCTSIPAAHTPLSIPYGYVINNKDCDDNNAAINSGAPEICWNNIDDNCNGQIDEVIVIKYYQDLDGDGYGNTNVFIYACRPEPGYVYIKGDCNDENSNIQPGATDICNGVDDDCSGFIDEDGEVLYRDADGDGYGNSRITTQSCTPLSGFVTNSTDCDDTKAAVNPDATEVCNGIDDDCDGLIDEGVTTTFYRDADGDGFGNAAVTIQACTVPSGYSSNSTDCNDGNTTIHPGAAEICGNNMDDDCDGLTDEGCNVLISYRSIQNGNWNSISTWQVSTDGGNNWANATATPTSADGSITIRNNHNVTVNSAVNADEVIVNTGATLTQTANLSIVNGPGQDLVVNGTYHLSSGTINGSGSLQVNGFFRWGAGRLQISTVLESTALLSNSNTSIKYLVSSLINNGTISLTSSIVSFINANLVNNGQLNIISCGFLQGSGVNSLTNNTNGIVTQPATGITTILVPFNNAGTINGLGNLVLNNFNNNGKINPGLSTGILSIDFLTNSQLFTNNSTLNIELKNNSGAGSGWDQLRRTIGNITLNGKIVVSETASMPSGSYEVIRTSFGTISGNFSSVQLPPGYSLRIQNNRVWLDKNNVFSVNQPGKIISSVELFPNPANEQVNIRLADEFTKGNINIQLADGTGRLMKQWSQQFAGKAHTIKVNIANISNGLYFIIIKNSNGKQVTEKLLIQH